MSVSSQRGSFAEVSIRSKIDRVNRTGSIGGNSSRTSRTSLPLSPTADMVSRVRTPSTSGGTPPKPPRKGSRTASMFLPPLLDTTTPREDEEIDTEQAPQPVAAPSPPSRGSMSATFTLKRVERPVMRGDGAEDLFSTREKDTIHEVNTLRTNPSGYATLMAIRMELHEPFVSHKRMTFHELEKFAGDMGARKAELTELLTTLDSREKEEVQQLQAQWAIEDVDRAKKAKKGGLGKKRGSGINEEADAVSEERAGILKELSERYASSRHDLQEEFESVSDKLHRSSHGVKLLRQCMRVVGGIPPCSAIQYSRGLSLAARDACRDGIKSLFSAAGYSRGYGQGGGFSTACFLGEEDVPQTVMEMLLGLQDPEKRSRQALLSSTATSVGCGWRDDKDGGCCTCLLMADQFEELRAIADRDHLPLLQVKHVLGVAQSESPGSVVTLDPRSGVTLVEPRHHPFECGNVARLLFACDGSVSLYGVLYNVLDDEPTQPSYGVGRFLCQRVSDAHTELRLIVPHRGEFGVVIFAKLGAPSGQPPSIGDGYTRIGKLLLRATQFDPTYPITCFPTTSGDFDNRKGVLLSPVSGLLPPSSIQTFHIRIPPSDYLQGELTAVANELTSIGAKLGRSGIDLQQLTSAVEVAMREVSEQESQTTLKVLTEEIAQVQREVTRKRGKELEKLKVLQADLEEQRTTLQATTSQVRERLVSAQAQLDAFRRAARQVEAHHRRLLREKGELQQSADRTAPLNVELSVGGKKALLAPVDDTSSCEYSVRLRTPASGRVSLFINGLLALTWSVGNQ